MFIYFVLLRMIRPGWTQEIIYGEIAWEMYNYHIIKCIEKPIKDLADSTAV